MTTKSALEARKIVAKNLSNLLNKHGITQTELARRLKLPEASVRSWVNANKYPRIQNVQKLADYFGVSRSDILEDKSDPSSPRRAFGVVNYPIVGEIKAGPNGIAEKMYEGYSAVLSSDVDRSYEYFWLKVYGDFMVGDGILDGDLALIKQTPEFENDDICAVIVDGEEGTLKHVSKHGSSIVLTASNSSYAPRMFVNEDCNLIKIAGKLVQIKRVYHWFKAQKLIGYKSCT